METVRPRLESRHSRKRLFFHRKISNLLNLNNYKYLGANKRSSLFCT